MDLETPGELAEILADSADVFGTQRSEFHADMVARIRKSVANEEFLQSRETRKENDRIPLKLYIAIIKMSAELVTHNEHRVLWEELAKAKFNREEFARALRNVEDRITQTIMELVNAVRKIGVGE